MDIEFDPEEFHRTNDMAMATYLKVQGHTSQRVIWEGGTCYWWFRINESLLDCVESFTNGDALIEPREYNRVFTQTKREFYDSKPPVKGGTKTTAARR